MKIGVISSLQSISVLCSKPLQQLPSKTRAAAGVGALGGSSLPMGAGKIEEPKPLSEGKNVSVGLFTREKSVFVARGCFTGRHRGNAQRNSPDPRPFSFCGLSLHVAASRPRRGFEVL